LNAKSQRGARGVQKLNSTGTLIQSTTTEAPQRDMYYIGLDVHKKTCAPQKLRMTQKNADVAIKT